MDLFLSWYPINYCSSKQNPSLLLDFEPHGAELQFMWPSNGLPQS